MNRISPFGWGKAITRARPRPGVSLIEAAFSLIVIGLAVSQGLKLVTDYSANRAMQAEARMLTAVADAYAGTVGRTWPPAVARGRVTTYTPPAHIGLETPFGRAIRIAHFAPSARELVVMVYTWSANRRTHRKPTPRYDSDIRQVGHVAGPNDRCPQNHVCGFGMDWNASSLLSLLGTNGPGPEDLVALRWVTMERHVSPYLHRNHMAGHPELNRLETDLNMGGHDLVGVNTLSGERLLVADDLDIDGALQVTDMDVSGDLAIGGNLGVTGTLTAVRMSAASRATVTNLDVAQQLELTNATIADDVTINDIQVTTDVEMTGTAGATVTGTIHANEAEVDEVTITGNLNGAVLDYEGRATTLSRVRTRDMIIGELTVTNNCNGC